MGLGRLLERKAPADRNRQLAFANQLERMLEAAAHHFAIAVNERQDESADLQRFLHQLRHVQRIWHPAGAAEENQMTERSQALQPLLEGWFTDRIEHQVDAAAAADTHDLGGEILLLVIDDLVGSVTPH